MHTDHMMMPLLNRPLAFRIHLAKHELTTLDRAATVLADIRERLESEHGEDDAIDIPSAQAWIYAESYLAGAMSDLEYGRIETPPSVKPGQ